MGVCCSERNQPEVKVNKVTNQAQKERALEINKNEINISSRGSKKVGLIKSNYQEDQVVKNDIYYQKINDNPPCQSSPKANISKEIPKSHTEFDQMVHKKENVSPKKKFNMTILSNNTKINYKVDDIEDIDKSAVDCLRNVLSGKYDDNIPKEKLVSNISEDRKNEVNELPFPQANIANSPEKYIQDLKEIKSKILKIQPDANNKIIVGNVNGEDENKVLSKSKSKKITFPNEDSKLETEGIGNNKSDKFKSIKLTNTESKEFTSNFDSTKDVVKMRKKDSNYYKTHSINTFNEHFDIGPKINKGKNVKDKYLIITQLGTGSFGTVFKVRHKESGAIRAMKIINKENIQYQDDEQKFLKEIEILIKVEHMNIIRIYEYFEDQRYYYIITDFINGGELYDTICEWEDFDENKARNIFYQVMSAVTYLHGRSIIHRDIKPENILVEKTDKIENEKNNFSYQKDNDINIKVIDFGTANYYSNSKKLSLVVGSPYYIAPEVLKGEYNQKCDIWSCGVLLYVLLVGYPPFEGNSKEELTRNIKTQKVNVNGDYWDQVSSSAKDLVLKMLERDPEKRLGSEEVMKHPWLMKEKNTIKIETSQKVTALNNMRNFHKQDKLQQATVAYITYFLTPTEEIKELKKLFKELDKNGDGTLSPSEMINGFKNVFGAVSDDIELKDILNDMDSNNDGVITYEEFLRVVVSKNNIINEKNIKLCFENFDSNHDGKLSAEEIKRALGAKNNEYVKSLISLIDENGNNEIDFDEFKQLMDVVLKKDEIEVDSCISN